MVYDASRAIFLSQFHATHVFDVSNETERVSKTRVSASERKRMREGVRENGSGHKANVKNTTKKLKQNERRSKQQERLRQRKKSSKTQKSISKDEENTNRKKGKV